jgi:hypothetical protein
LTGAEGEDDARTRMLRIATTEHGADWVLSSDADEFWWPRGESMQDVLEAIPPRYAVIQALVRVFCPRGGDSAFAERMTVRASLLGASPDHEPLPYALRPLYRADPRLVSEPGDGTDRGRRVPLRGWYPIEVLRFPFRTPGQADESLRAWLREGRAPRSKIEAEGLDAYRQGGLGDWYAQVAAEARINAGLADGSLVVDARLREALRTIASPSLAGARGLLLPSESATPLFLRVPDIVDDASYAAECAAVGEVDLERLDRHIRELEARIAALEARFWPSVRRALTRLVRR